jgi:hypothetical protein
MEAWMIQQDGDTIGFHPLTRKTMAGWIIASINHLDKSSSITVGIISHSLTSKKKSRKMKNNQNKQTKQMRSRKYLSTKYW